MSTSAFPVIAALDALTGALFLLTALQSLLLTFSAILLGIALNSLHLLPWR